MIDLESYKQNLESFTVITPLQGSVLEDQAIFYGSDELDGLTTIGGVLKEDGVFFAFDEFLDLAAKSLKDVIGNTAEIIPYVGAGIGVVWDVCSEIDDQSHIDSVEGYFMAAKVASYLGCIGVFVQNGTGGYTLTIVPGPETQQRIDNF